MMVGNSIPRPAWRVRAACILGLLLLAGALPARSETPALSLSVYPPEIPFHRQAVYTVTLESADAAAPPEIGPAPNGVEMRQESLRTEETPGGRYRVHRSYVIDPVFMGDFLLPLPEALDEDAPPLAPLALRVRDLTDAERDLAARFASVLDPESAAPSGPPLALWAGLAGLVLAAAAIAGWLYWRRLGGARALPPAPPWEVAQQRLEALRVRELPQQGRSEAYYVDLSAILRYYIEDRLHLHAPEQTTQEFLEAAARSGQLTPGHQELLAGFLLLSDRVKFARYEPELEEMNGSFALVERFVRETTPRPEDDAAPREAAA